MKKLLAAVVLVGTTSLSVASVAMADPPGPGDPQCIPGQQGNPHPGHQGGSCH